MAAQVGTTALGGYVTAQRVSAAVTGTQAETANAILAKVSLSAGAVVLRTILEVTDMDSGAAGLVDVGYTGDDDAFTSNFSIQTAGVDSYGDEDDDVPVVLADDTDIEVTISTPASTGVAGTVTLTVIYFQQ